MKRRAIACLMVAGLLASGCGAKGADEAADKDKGTATTALSTETDRGRRYGLEVRHPRVAVRQGLGDGEGRRRRHRHRQALHRRRQRP